MTKFLLLLRLPLNDVNYLFPIGRRRHFAPQSRIVNGIVGGWSMNGALSLQSGPPLGWGAVFYYGAPLHFNPHNPDGPTFDRIELGERRYMQLRFEFFNVTNRVTFSAPQLSPTNSALGVISSQANNPRKIQMAARVVW